MMFVASSRPPRPVSRIVEDEGYCRKSLEESHLQALLALEARYDGEYLFRSRFERVVWDGRAVDEEPLVEGDEVRRGVSYHSIACGAENGIEHGGGSALAVRAGDVDAAEGVLRIAERGHNRADCVEARLHAEAATRGEGEKEWFDIRHSAFDSRHSTLLHS